MDGAHFIIFQLFQSQSATLGVRPVLACCLKMIILPLSTTAEAAAAAQPPAPLLSSITFNLNSLLGHVVNSLEIFSNKTFSVPNKHRFEKAS